jgi:hypothetical protein
MVNAAELLVMPMCVLRRSCSLLAGGPVAQEQAEHDEGDGGTGDGREPTPCVSTLSPRQR